MVQAIIHQPEALTFLASVLLCPRAPEMSQTKCFHCFQDPDRSFAVHNVFIHNSLPEKYQTWTEHGDRDGMFASGSDDKKHILPKTVITTKVMFNRP